MQPAIVPQVPSTLPPPPSRRPGVAAAVLSTCVRSRVVSWLAVAVVLTALILPPQGFGMPTCQFHELTRLPCFGCGLTRSFVGMAHLNLGRAALYHPGGIPLFILCLAFAALLPARAHVRERLAAWVEERGRPATYLAVAFLAFFIGYGLLRMAWVASLLASGRPSPW